MTDKLTSHLWPLGEGVIMVAIGMLETAGAGTVPAVVMRAVPDEMLDRVPGTPAKEAEWNYLEDAPEVTITFKNAACLDRHIEMLQDLRKNLND